MKHKNIDDEFRYRMMLRTVEALHDKCIEKDLGLSSGKGLWMPLLTIICSFIDGLSKLVDEENEKKSKATEENEKKSKATKARYIKYIEDNFKGLNTYVGGKNFYEKFRTNQIHEFSLPEGYGISRENSFKTPWYIKKENSITYLNIDKLYSDFHKHVKELWEKSKKE